RADVVCILMEPGGQVFNVIPHSHVDGETSRSRPVISYERAVIRHRETRCRVAGDPQELVEAPGGEIGQCGIDVETSEAIFHRRIERYPVVCSSCFEQVVSRRPAVGIRSLLMLLSATAVAFPGPAELDQASDVHAWMRRIIRPQNRAPISELETKISH